MSSKSHQKRAMRKKKEGRARHGQPTTTRPFAILSVNGGTYAVAMQRGSEFVIVVQQTPALGSSDLGMVWAVFMGLAEAAEAAGHTVLVEKPAQLREALEEARANTVDEQEDIRDLVEKVLAVHPFPHPEDVEAFSRDSMPHGAR